jgi:hypothetical protein
VYLQDLFGQTLLFKGQSIDTITITTKSSGYNTRTRTEKGQTERLVIVKQKGHYLLQPSFRNSYQYISTPQKKRKIYYLRQLFYKRILPTDQLQRLLQSIQDKPDLLFWKTKLSSKLKQKVTRQAISRLSKKNRLIINQKKFTQNYRYPDTFQLFLEEKFSNENDCEYTISSNVSDYIHIRIKSDTKTYLFEAQYPNLFKQPWYKLDTEQLSCSYNLSINHLLYQLLPKGFVNRKSISTQVLWDSYIIWCLNRYHNLHNLNF